MKKWMYEIEILNIDGNPTGIIIVNSGDAQNEIVGFSPLNILGDLYYSIYDDVFVNSILRSNQIMMIDNISNHTQVYEIYNEFDAAFNIKTHVCDSCGAFQYYQLLTSLSLFFNFRNEISLLELYQIREQFKLNFQWKTYIINDVEKYASNPSAVDALTELMDEEYSEIKYILKNKPHHCFYRCESKADVVFSVLQYLLLSGHYFRPCLHCQKYFATKSPESDYCCRTSPFKGFDKYVKIEKPKELEELEKFRELDCEKAVKYIKKKLENKYKKSVYINMNQKYGGGSERITRFVAVCEMFKSKIKDKPNVENLGLYMAFLTNSEIRANYYSEPGNNSSSKK